MDNTTTRKTVLPKELSDLIANPATFEQIDAIGSKFGLNRVETGLLAQVTGLLLTGEIRPNEFVSTLIDYVSVPQEKAMLIAQDINRDIFNSVKDALKQLHSVGDEKAPVIKATPATLSSTSHTIEALPATPIPKEAVVTQVFEPAQPRPVQISTPQPVVPPKIIEDPKPTIPFGAIPEEKPVVNNLESKLGGAFTIKKEVMFTAQSTPSPVTPPPQPLVPTQKPSVTQTQPAIPTPQAKVLDPYRELPS